MKQTTISEDTMHGSLFVLFKRYIEHIYDYSTWLKLLEKAGLTGTSYQMREMYPTQELSSLLQEAAAFAGIPVYALMERFGEFMVPDLLMVYNKYIRSEWTAYEMLLHTEETMHRAVRQLDPRTNPPKLLVTKNGNKELIVDYSSKRRMAGVAVGIIRGIVRYYHESNSVRITLLTGTEEEQVQIKIEFFN